MCACFIDRCSIQEYAPAVLNPYIMEPPITGLPQNKHPIYAKDFCNNIEEHAFAIG